MGINKSTIGGYPIYNPPNARVCPNCFEMHSGAARVGWGRFCMRQEDAAALIGTGESDPEVVLHLEADQDSGAPGDGLDLNVVIAAAAPLSPDTSGAADKSMVEVVVYDQRYAKMMSKVREAYNCARPESLATSPAASRFYSDTLNAGAEHTWSSLWSDLAGLSHTGLPTWKPRNIIADDVPIPRAIDDTAARIFFIVGYDHAANAYELFLPGFMDPFNAELKGRAVEVGSGGETQRSTGRLPANIVVAFRINDQDNANNPWVNRFHEVTVAVGGAGPDMVLHVGEYVAVRRAAVIQNSAELTAVANDIAARAFDALTATFETREYAGIWPFFPDGAIRGIRWTSDKAGARTTIRLNNDQDWSPIAELRRVFELASNQALHGLGEAAVTSAPSKSKVISIPPTLRTLKFVDGEPKSTGSKKRYYDVKILKPDFSSDPISYANDGDAWFQFDDEVDLADDRDDSVQFIFAVPDKMVDGISTCELEVEGVTRPLYRARTWRVTYFYVKIISSVSVDSSGRRNYTVKKVKKTGTGYTTWTTFGADITAQAFADDSGKIGTLDDGDITVAFEVRWMQGGTLEKETWLLANGGNSDWARITASAVLADNRWTYSLAKADEAGVAIPGGWTSTTALNGAEFPNTAAAFGGYVLTDFPDGSNPHLDPIATGESVLVIKRGGKYLFSRTNPVKMDCDDSGSDTFEGTNTSGSTIEDGMPVVSAGDGDISHGDADNNEPIVGFATEQIVNTATGTVRTNGVITVADWSPVVGAADLTPDTEYFLSGTAGQMTTTPPSADGKLWQPLGKAVSLKEFAINIGPPVLL